MVALIASLCYQPLLFASMWVFYLFAWCIRIVVFYSVAQPCLTLCDPLNCTMSSFPVLHYLWVCWNSCPLSWWCHPTISSSAIPLSCPQSFPASGSFQMSQLFESYVQSIEASASVSVLSMNIQGVRIDWFDLFVQGTLKILLQYHHLKASTVHLVSGLISQEIIPYIAIDLVCLWKEVSSGTSCISTLNKNPNYSLKKFINVYGLILDFENREETHSEFPSIAIKLRRK